jgi:hypothetical protein
MSRGLRDVANFYLNLKGVCFVLVGFRGHYRHHPPSSLYIVIRDFQISPVTLFCHIDKADSAIQVIFRSQCASPPMATDVRHDGTETLPGTMPAFRYIPILSKSDPPQAVSIMMLLYPKNLPKLTAAAH